jgi:predicted esterase
MASGLSAAAQASSGAPGAPGAHAPDGVPGTRRDFPCSGCITIAPPSYSPDKPAPLLVLLHGDEGTTSLVLRAWKAPLERRGYLLLALRCPKNLGCEKSYWRWGGDPAWIVAQVDAVASAFNVDRGRVYLSGWSGGSTYLTLSSPLLSPRFAAINVNGGGAPPRSPSCAPCKAPVYYFMGGQNPYLSSAEAARDHFKQCGQEVVWDFAPRLDHTGEFGALAGPVAERVLDWLETKRSACLNNDAPQKTQNSAELPVNTPAVRADSLTPEPRSAPPSCGCRQSPSQPFTGPALLAVALGALAARRSPSRASYRRGAPQRSYPPFSGAVRTARTSPPPNRAI